MPNCDTLICNANVVDGTGTDGILQDVAISGDRIVEIGQNLGYKATMTIQANGRTLTPGFIDSHTHDDLSVIHAPQMLPKLSQGVTTVIAGNCGISAAPVQLRGDLPDPMNLLGDATWFQYPTFSAYKAAVAQAQPAVNVAAFAGHTSLRSNHMERLDRAATMQEVAAMRAQLTEALEEGALGLSTGLAYLSAISASTEEVLELARPLAAAGALYATHLRSETEGILDALDEAFTIGSRQRVPVVVSHLKCAGLANWGLSEEVLHTLDEARTRHSIGWDCYPYAAGSSTLDLRQVDERVKITITWSTPHPAAAGRPLSEIAAQWDISQLEAAKRLQPAGAIYHSISELDMRAILRHPATMIGSDGLPNDPHPHPRLWGTFPRILGRYSREEKLFSLPEAVHKMTQLPAQRFGLTHRGTLRPGNFADLVLFDAEKMIDTATFEDPVKAAEGILGVWVNGVLSYDSAGATGQRAGTFLSRGAITWPHHTAAETGRSA